MYNRGGPGLASIIVYLRKYFQSVVIGTSNNCTCAQKLPLVKKWVNYMPAVHWLAKRVVIDKLIKNQEYNGFHTQKVTS